MESFPSIKNISTSGLSFNSNETGLNYEELHGFNLADLLSLNNSQQRQPVNINNVKGSTNTHTAANTLASSTSRNPHGFSQSAVSLSNNMLPTPEGFDNNVPESMIISPYNMMNDSGVFQEDELFFEPLDSPPLTEPSSTSFMQSYVTIGHLSPQTSPSLPPDPSLTRHQNRKEKSSFNQNSSNSKYFPIDKVFLNSNNNNNSTPQSRKKSSFNNSSNDNNYNNINKSNNTNEQNNTTTNLLNIMTASSNKLLSNSITSSLLESTSSLNNITSTSMASPLQDTMPNLNLESNLVSSGMTMQSLLTSIISNESSSSFPDKIVPITPSTLMKMKMKQPNSLKPEQNEQISNKQLNPPSNIQPLLIAQSPQSQIRTIMATTNGTASPSGTSNGKSSRPNPNASSPLALGPSKSPQTLKPTISPNLKPKLPGVLADEIAKELANKSNYQSILEGTAQSLGISYPSDVHLSLESRRTTHKAAEQKRRDLLKQSFDELKKVVLVSSESINYDGKNTNDDDNGKSGEGSVKNISKLFLLKRAHDHIVELEQKTKEKDELIQKLRSEVDELKRTKKRKTEGTEVITNNNKN